VKIVVWTGGAREAWGRDSWLVGGVGGSETAPSRVAHHLALLGHEVVVRGRVIPSEESLGDLGGRVTYSPHDPSRPWRPECDVFASSRELDALANFAPRCRLKVFWAHDASAGEDWRDLMSGYDVVFCLSGWARSAYMQQYPDVPADRFCLTRNGVEPSLFLREGEAAADPRPVAKRGCRCVYSSSPDRGLGRLLDLWPRVRRASPEAELCVYYGFDGWRAGAAGKPSVLRRIDYLEHRLRLMGSEGVRYCGRVGQSDLARSLMEARFWLYPTHFAETSCIAAMEAQAAGAFPVATRLGALPETVRWGRLLTWRDDPADYEDDFASAVEHSLSAGARTAESDMLEARRWALANLSWEGVARQWHDLFASRLGVPPLKKGAS